LVVRSFLNLNQKTLVAPRPESLIPLGAVQPQFTRLTSEKDWMPLTKG
jgi:hypothetical protein